MLDVGVRGKPDQPKLPDISEGIEGSNFNALGDVNKTPIRAFFKPDPVTGVLSTNPENLGANPNGTTSTPTGNVAADYHPYGYAYGTASVLVSKGISYTNYNALQVAWIKQTGKLNFNLNGTWSKTLGTGLQTNPFYMRANYGPTATDRPFVFNASYTYQTGKLSTSSMFANQVLGGWTISGISTWQAGGYIPAALGNGVPNFALGMSYTTASITPALKAQGVSTGIGSATYFGTDAPLPIMPVLTCNPTSNLGHYQRVNGTCFAAPAIGSQGGKNYPYMSAAAYFNHDLAIYRSFRIHETQQIQIRASAFNWLNHPIPGYSSLTPLTLNYVVDYASKNISTNYNTSTFGVMDSKTGASYQRIIELNIKYFF